jgi:hypothetical protein
LIAQLSLQQSRWEKEDQHFLHAGQRRHKKEEAASKAGFRSTFFVSVFFVKIKFIGQSSPSSSLQPQQSSKLVSVNFVGHRFWPSVCQPYTLTHLNM